MAAEKKQVRTRVVFKGSFFTNGTDHLDVIDTFNMAERKYLDRDIDMLVVDEDGLKYRIKKELIAMIKEIKMVAQEVVEVEHAVEEPAE